MGFSLQVHHFRRDPKTNYRILQKVIPYVAIGTREGRLYAQNGKVWSEGGEEITDVPAWFWEKWRLVNPEKRRLIGLLLPEEQAAIDERAAKERAAAELALQQPMPADEPNAPQPTAKPASKGAKGA